MTEDIPAPLVLDPDRVLRDDRDDMTAEDHRSQARLLDTALHESCAYAQQLWNDLAAARQYLYDSLPPTAGGGEAPEGVSPNGPDDEQGWQRWTDAYAGITSVLCGPHGDNGFARTSAMSLAQSRREVTVPTAGRHASVDDLAALTRTEPADDALQTAMVHADPAPRHGVADDRPSDAGPQLSPRLVLAPLLYGAVGSVTTVLALRKRLRKRP